jgi:hypothetical protein
MAVIWARTEETNASADPISEARCGRRAAAGGNDSLAIAVALFAAFVVGGILGKAAPAVAGRCDRPCGRGRRLRLRGPLPAPAPESSITGSCRATAAHDGGTTSELKLRRVDDSEHGPPLLLDRGDFPRRDRLRSQRYGALTLAGGDGVMPGDIVRVTNLPWCCIL